MTNQEILAIAMAQSAIDSHCNASDFLQTENLVVISAESEGARKYLKLPFECDLISYGNNIVASVREDLVKVVRSYVDKYPLEHCFETPNMHVLNDELQKKQLRVCFMAEYFLPNLECLKPLPCPYEIGIITDSELADLYRPEWGNALNEDRKQLDRLGAGAYHNGKLIGLAGCSADCHTMWQIGIDVLPEYRRKGIASALTSRLAVEILDRGKVPFYCAAWSNLSSVRNAIKSGFRPAWVELTAKTSDIVAEMNV